MIAIVQLLFVFLFASFRGARAAFLCFVFFLPFMPRYLGIPVGTGSISGVRIVLVLFLVMLLLWVGKKSRFFEMVGMIRKESGLFWILTFMFVVKVIATVTHMGAENLAYVIDDFLASMPVFLLSMILFRTYESRKLLLIAIVSSLFVCEILSVLEFFKQAPLLLGIYEIEVVHNDEVELGTARDDAYRTQAFFDNPLLFAEFVSFSWPLAWFLSRNAESKTLRPVFWLSLLMAPVTLYFIGARGGWLVSGLTFLYLMFFYFWHRIDRFLRMVAGLFASVGVVSAVIFVIAVLVSPDQYFDSYDTGGRSSLYRIEQYFTVAEEVAKNPFGFGAHRNYEGELEFLLTLDSYWLRLLLEGGFLELLAFASFFFLVYRRAYKIKRQVMLARENQLIFVMIATLLSLTLYKFFVSMPFNTIYMYIIAGVIMSWDTTAGAKHAHVFRRNKHRVQ